MRVWPFNRNPKASVGQQAAPDGDYTARVVADFEALATGVRADAGKLAAVEFAAGLLGRTLARATVEASPAVQLAATGHVRAMIGRCLVRRGELVAMIDVSPDDGAVELAPAGSWDIRGSHRPDSWRYRCDLFGPSGSITRLLPAAGVCHFRWNVDPSRPWHGQPATALASATASTAGEAENSLMGESKVTLARVAASAASTSDQATDYARMLSAGGVVPVVGGMGPMTGGGIVPTTAFKPARMGPEPPAELIELRRDAARELCESIGIPAPLFVSGASEGAQRAAWRRYLVATAAPAAEMVAAELSLKLETPVRLDVGMLATSDAAVSEARARGSRANAYSVLVGAGMGDQEARRLAGLDA